MFVIHLHEVRGSLMFAYKLISKYILRYCMATILFLLKKKKVIVMKVKYF
jgi:hypothetical protein